MKLSFSVQIVLMFFGVVALVAATALVLLNWVSPQAPQLVRVEGEQTVEFADGTIRFQNRGEGAEATVFLHGFNGQLSDWDKVWSNVNRCGRTIRLDIPGFGGSSWRTDEFALPEQGQRVMAFLDTMGLDRVTLVGASMGGSLAAWIASVHPARVRNMLLLAPSGYPDSLHYPGVFGMLVKPGLANRIATWIARTRVYAALFPASRALQATTVTASYGSPWAQALARISAPALLIWSRGDTSFHAASNVAAAIRDSQLLPIAPDAGHLLPDTRSELAAIAACRLALGFTLQEISDEVRPMLVSAGDQ
jgi:pimeloyl-ACP methyl ester carboxylesterase